MSGDERSFDVKSFLGVFFDEAAEHLVALEEGLLRLEGAADDPELIAAIFRAAHSIKGSGASVGLTEVAQFTHALEGALGRVRDGSLAATANVVNVFLGATDVLKALVAAARDGQPAPTGAEAVTRELKALLGEAAPASRAVSAAAPVATRRKGTSAGPAYRVTFAPDPALFKRGSDPMRVFEQLAAAGELCEVEADLTRLPDLAAMDPEASYLGFRLTVRTLRSPAELRALFEDLGGEFTVSPVAPAAEPAKSRETAPRAPVRASEGSSIRVSTEKVDRLINLVGELVIGQSMINQIIDTFTPEKLANLREAVADLERNTRELQERVMAVRMMPVGSVFSRLPRLVRDLCASLGKKATLQITGAETELDKSVLEQLGDPLTHLVRNAVDHGIETPAGRISAGKPEEAVIKLRAAHQGGNVIIELEDDGKGLDRARIRAKAVAQELIKETDVLTDEQIHELIFCPGLSTAQVATDVSGRGVGMDVVRKNVDALNGTIQVETKPGRGTRFRITLPLTLAVLDGLCVGIAEQVYVLPLVSIVESLRPGAGAVKTIAGRGEVIIVRDQILPLIRLHRLLGLTGVVTDPTRGLVVIVENEGRSYGLLVDEVRGQSQVVIKSLEANFRRVDAVMGATILGDGHVALILDVQGIVRLGRLPPAERAERRAQAS